MQVETEHRIKGLAFSLKQTAEAIASVFARQVSFYREQTDNLLILNENSIISGINETLIIKTEVLAENITSFIERIKAVTDDLLRKKILINEAFPK